MRGVAALGAASPCRPGVVFIDTMTTTTRHRRRRTARVTQALGLLLTCAYATWGCGSGGPGGPSSGKNAFTAKIDGKAWASTAGAETVGAQHAGTGIYTITGLVLGSANAFGMSFQLYNIGGAATYPLGVGPQVFGGAVSLSSPAGGWSTPLHGDAGQIVFATLTDTRMAGTFAFVATALPGSTGTHTVTDGRFDLPVNTLPGAGPLPDNAGSKVTGTLGGTPFAAGNATSILTTGMPATLTITASNGERNLTISLAEMTGPGTYALSATNPIRSVQVSGVPGDPFPSWNSQVAAPGGSVIVTSVTASRIAGTFDAALAPLAGGATGPLAVSGAFDMGRH
ncbi:MAG: hypothetical protein ABUS79_14215 [Pseudomonadota bacterium]